ncbi:MAG: hypothetical protein OXI96_06140 [Acidimicrobiaceae bacterium]|nr:hypothetical protein [Acidimicrobiaceae bacterium]
MYGWLQRIRGSSALLGLAFTGAAVGVLSPEADGYVMSNDMGSVDTSTMSLSVASVKPFSRIVGSDTDAGHAQFEVSNVAPNWPFDGVINWYTPFDVHMSDEFMLANELQYRSAVDGKTVVIPFPIYMPACAENSFISVSEYGTVVVLKESATSNDFAVLRVPWGDDVYPFFAAPNFVDWTDDNVKTWSEETMFGDIRVTAGMVDFYWLELSAGDDVRYYPVYTDHSGPPEGHETPESYVPSVSGDEHNPKNWYLPSTSMLGTDGQLYGFASASFEPLCDNWQVFVLAADTGELVGCGTAMVAPVLGRTHSGVTRVEEFIFPETDMGANYDERCGTHVDLKQFASLS